MRTSNGSRLLNSFPDATAVALFDLEDETDPRSPTFPAPDKGVGAVGGGRGAHVPTQGIKYAGSKLKLIPQILDLVHGLDVSHVWDAFSGTTRVSQALARSGYVVESNDRAVWSEHFSRAYLLNRRERHAYVELMDHLNHVAPLDGWFTDTYGGIDDGGSAVQGDGLKKLWQVKNTRKLDGIREEIAALRLDEVTESIALASLILALDKVDSTMGHFVSYLREWAPRAYNDLKLEVPALWPNEAEHSVTRMDVLAGSGMLGSGNDLAYLDPPYGSNNEKMPPSRVRYQSYYHIWTTVIQNDRPDTFGAARRRADSSDTLAASEFEEFRRNPATGRFLAVEALDKLLARTDTPYIMLSYSSDGRATAAEIDEVLRANGTLLSTAVVDYKRNVMSGMVWTGAWLREVQTRNQEFIFLLQK